MEQKLQKTYKTFSSAFKNAQNQWVGHNFVGVKKENFHFKMKVYYDLPVPIGNKTFTYREYNFMSLPGKPNKVFGIETKKIKQNNQMNDCVNYFVSNKAQLPMIDLTKDLKDFSRDQLLETIKEGMVHTKEFYAKHPPLENQPKDIKVFETTIEEPKPKTFRVNNLTDKYFNGKLNINGEEFAVIYFPFDGQNKNILVPYKNYHSNEDGSFSVFFDQESYKTIPTKQLKEINKFEYVDSFKDAFEKKPKEKIIIR